MGRINRKKKNILTVSRTTFYRRVLENIATVENNYHSLQPSTSNTPPNSVSPNSVLPNTVSPNSVSLNAVSSNAVSPDSPNSDSSNSVSPNLVPLKTIPTADELFHKLINDYDYINMSDDDSDSDLEADSESIFQTKLTSWAKESNSTLSSITKLLLILRQHGHPYLPKVAQTLLSTPTKHTLITVDPGYYIHIGLEKNLLKIIKQTDPAVLLLIDINIDGVPITNSTKKQFWPILGRCSQLSSNPFAIGIYYGLKKTDLPSIFLKIFCDEVNKLEDEGFIYNQKKYFIKINAIICDAPAQSYIKCIISFNGYFGCGKCTQEGEFNRRLFYPEIEFNQRTDSSFRNRLDDIHHKGDSILEELKIDMVLDFPGDYLHLICLGAVKKLMVFWTTGPIPIRQPALKQQHISARLVNARQSQPVEFQRRIRGLDELSYFKGSEFRTTLFYTGPVVLKNILSTEEYNNFLTLHIATRICNDKNLHQYLEIARQLYIHFVRTYIEIYGEEFVSYNIHNLLHVVDDVMRFGVLENFSAYPFESFLGKLKKKIRHGNKILEQAVGRTLEGWDLELEKTVNKYPILKNPKFSDKLVTHYLCIETRNAKFKSDDKNSHFMTNNFDIIRFEYAMQSKTDSKIQICGRKYLKKRNLYETPLESSLIGIFEIPESSLSAEMVCLKLEDIKCKIFVIREDGMLASFPMHDFQ